MSLVQCDQCEAYRSTRWIDLRTGDLASGSALQSGNASQLCLDCQGDVRASADVENAYAAREATDD